MRIMQINSFPIRQNRIAFRGEDAKPAEKEAEKPLSEQIKDVKLNLEDKELFAQAEAAYLNINGKASERIFGGSTVEADIEAFVDSGVAYVRSVIAIARKQDIAKQLIATEKIIGVFKAFGAIHNTFPNLKIDNPFVETLANLPIIFR